MFLVFYCYSLSGLVINTVTYFGFFFWFCIVIVCRILDHSLKWDYSCRISLQVDFDVSQFRSRFAKMYGNPKYEHLYRTINKNVLNAASGQIVDAKVKSIGNNGMAMWIVEVHTVTDGTIKMSPCLLQVKGGEVLQCKSRLCPLLKWSRV